ncbi:ABC transporter ATP-binding protein, partial [Mesorhizobium sp. M7A.F.Ca.CA.002.04.1.1]
MAGVQVSDVSRSFGAHKALDNVSIDFADGGFYALLGPSGSGKTTLLRQIAGFDFPDSGRITIGGESVERVPVEKRRIGMVFQNYALFPNMSVADNVAFGLSVRGEAKAVIATEVQRALDLVQLGKLGGRRPHQLSGGQRQRVALARAIVTKPRVLLLDEPLGALDKALRVDMQIELKRIQREIGITTIFVTHDQEEALTMSDRIGILRDGRLVQ